MYQLFPDLDNSFSVLKFLYNIITLSKSFIPLLVVIAISSDFFMYESCEQLLMVPMVS